MKPARGASAALRWNNQDFRVALGGVYGRQSRNANTANAISYPDEPGLRKPDSLHFFRIVKEQPNETYGEATSHGLALSFQPKKLSLVEPTGIEPVTSCLQSRRSPS